MTVHFSQRMILHCNVLVSSRLYARLRSVFLTLWLYSISVAASSGTTTTTAVDRDVGLIRQVIGAYVSTRLEVALKSKLAGGPGGIENGSSMLYLLISPRLQTFNFT